MNNEIDSKEYDSEKDLQYIENSINKSKDILKHSKFFPNNVHNKLVDKCKNPDYLEDNGHSTHVIKERQVLILYTGGTIGMCKGPNGLAPKKNFLLEYMFNHPNFCDKSFIIKKTGKENIQPTPDMFLVTPETTFERRVFYKIFEFDDIIDSSNMNMDYWKVIGRCVKQFYHEFDAFIILHGTDTMNYTACCLSFMFENLNKPVILTGSQIPLIEMRNDALKNLTDALIVAGTYHIPEVTLIFDSKLFRGNRTIKFDNAGLDAFASPNMRPLIEIGINLKVNWDLILPAPTEEFSYFEDLDSHICIVKFFPIIKDSTFESFFKPSIKAVIIETYGAGSMPKDRPKIYEVMKSANERGVIIVNVSQCRKGTALNENAAFFESIGVVLAGDMTVECCLAKLSYLLGKNYESKKIKELFQTDLRGEMTILEKEMFSLHSNRFVDALLTMMNMEKKTEDKYIIASTLLPTVINELVEKNNLSLLKKLKPIIKRINFKNFTKKNPLLIAAINGNLPVATFLIKCRININELDNEKYTPLNYACMNKHKEVAHFLKNNGGILNQNNDMGVLLCSYAYQGDLEIIRLFYECGANIMIGDYDQKTIAHVAASEGKTDIITFLIDETNVNIMVEDRWGRTPYSIASGEMKLIIGKKHKLGGLSKKKLKRSKRKLNKSN